MAFRNVLQILGTRPLLNIVEIYMHAGFSQISLIIPPISLVRDGIESAARTLSRSDITFTVIQGFSRRMIVVLKKTHTLLCTGFVHAGMMETANFRVVRF